MKTKKQKTENVFLLHQINIAKKTLKMNDIFINVMGGMTKKEAIKILQENNIKY